MATLILFQNFDYRPVEELFDERFHQSKEPF